MATTGKSAPPIHRAIGDPATGAGDQAFVTETPALPPGHRTPDKARRTAGSVLDNDSRKTGRSRRDAGTLRKPRDANEVAEDAAANENKRLQELLQKASRGQLTEAERAELDRMARLQEEANKHSALAYAANGAKQLILYIIPQLMASIAANSKEGLEKDMQSTLAKLGIGPQAASIQENGHKADRSQTVIPIANTSYQIEIDSRYITGKDNPFAAANRARLSPSIIQAAAAAPKPAGFV